MQQKYWVLDCLLLPNIVWATPYCPDVGYSLLSRCKGGNNTYFIEIMLMNVEKNHIRNHVTTFSNKKQINNHVNILVI